MGFTGIFNHGLDQKNRIFIPAEFREELGENFYLYRAVEHCITVYTAERWQQITENIEGDTNSEKCRKIKRMFFSRVSSCRMDKQGRITIPANLIAHASLEKDVVVVGMGNCIEIWNAVKWKEIEDDDDEELFEGVYF